MSEEEKKINQPRKHVFDGIYEYDNDMPQWWLRLFWATIIFSIGYMGFYHVPRHEPRGLIAEYDRAVAEDKARTARLKTKTGQQTIDWESATKDESLLARAKETWTAMCAACHLESGGGSVGPNLTDNAWIHGFTPEAITASIANGIIANGMPAWGPILGDTKIQELVAFIKTIQNTNVAGGKPPQGDILDQQ